MVRAKKVKDINLAVLTGELAEQCADSVMRLRGRRAITEANKAPIDADLFRKVVDVVTRRFPGRDVLGRAMTMHVYLVTHRHQGDPARISRSIELRMQALGRLRDEPAFQAWSLLVDKAEPARVDELLLETAAAHPLIFRDDFAAFEADSFFREALAQCRVAGEA